MDHDLLRKIENVNLEDSIKTEYRSFNKEFSRSFIFNQLDIQT